MMRQTLVHTLITNIKYYLQHPNKLCWTRPIPKMTIKRLLWRWSCF